MWGLTFDLTALRADELLNFSEPRSHRGHRRSHTSRILVQQTNSDFEGSKVSESRRQALLSLDLTEMNSISSTTIESEMSGPETAQRRLESKKPTVTAVVFKAAQHDLGLLSELQDSMQSILREDYRRREKLQADRRRIKLRMAVLIKLRSQGYGGCPRQLGNSRKLSGSCSGPEGRVGHSTGRYLAN
jgi:hypothetical protein